MHLRFRSGKSKYKAVKTELDGHVFSSKKEAGRYAHLKLLLRLGEIDALELQPKYVLEVNGQRICAYIADFRYRDVKTGKIVVEDVKSTATKTPVYLLKKKLVAAIHGVIVAEV
jgi:hypothetical protein